MIFYWTVTILSLLVVAAIWAGCETVYQEQKRLKKEREETRLWQLKKSAVADSEK